MAEARRPWLVPVQYPPRGNLRQPQVRRASADSRRESLADILTLIRALNKRSLRGTFLHLFSTATLYSLFLLLLTSYLGFTRFMDDIRSRLDKAAVLEVKSPFDIIIVLPEHWNYGSGLIITRDSFTMLNDIFQAFQVITMIIALVFTVSQIASSVRMIRAEIKTNYPLFEALRSGIVPKRIILSSYLVDSGLKSLGAISLGLLISWLLVFPILDVALAHNLLHYYLVLDRNSLAAFSGGVPSLFSFGLDYLLLRKAIP